MTTQTKNKSTTKTPQILTYPLPSNPDDTFPLYVVFPDWLARYVDRLSFITKTRRGSNALMTLSAIATSLCKGIKARGVGRKTVKPNLFILLGAPVGYGKSEGFDEFLSPLTRIFRQKTREAQIYGRARLITEKGKLKREKGVYESGYEKDEDGKKKKIDYKKCNKELERIEARLLIIEEEEKVKVWAGRDVTSESLKEAMSCNGGLFFSASPDAKKTIQVTEGLYKNGASDETAWLSAYNWEDDDSLRTDGRYQFIEQPCANLCWCAPNNAISSLVRSGTLSQSGFISRCIIQIEPRYYAELEENEDIPDDWRLRWETFLQTNLDKFLDLDITHLIDYEPEAKERLRVWGNQVKKEVFYQLQHIEDQAARWGEHAWRISLVLHCLFNHGKETKQISLDTVEKAIKIGEWIIKRQKVLWEFKGEEESSQIWKLVETSLKNWSKNADKNPGKFAAATAREIKRGQNAGFDKLNLPHKEALEGALMPFIHDKRLLDFKIGKTRYYILNIPTEVARFREYHKLDEEEVVDFGKRESQDEERKVENATVKFVVLAPPEEPKPKVRIRIGQTDEELLESEAAGLMEGPGFEEMPEPETADAFYLRTGRVRKGPIEMAMEYPMDLDF